MPLVKKQMGTAATKPKPTASPGMVSKPMSTMQRGMKVCMYGRGKTGKTRLASSWPKKLLFLGGEDGWASIGTGLRKEPETILATGTTIHRVMIRGKPTEIDFVRLQTSLEMEELIAICKNYYASGVMDTGGGFQDILIKEVGGLSEIPVQRSWGLLKQEQWGIVNLQWKNWVSKFLNLADTSAFNSIVIAHERDFSKENGTLGDSSLIAPDIGPDLTPGSSRWINGACDYVVNMFKRRQVRMEKIAGLDEEQMIPTGEVEYCLRIEGSGAYTTGFRCCLLPGEKLPEVIVEPSYAKLRKIIEG